MKKLSVFLCIVSLYANVSAQTGNVGIGTSVPATKLDIVSGETTNNTVVNASGSINDFLQFNIQNTSIGNQAQSGYSATADNGSKITSFAWMGINNSTFSFPTPYNIGGPNDVSYVGSGQDMYIANANNSKSIIFSTGIATTPYFAERMRITNLGNIGIGTSAPAYMLDVAGTGHYTGLLTIGAITLPNTDGAASQVLTTNGSGSVSWQSVFNSSGWSLTGNSGTSPGTNFIGTNDNQSLVFKANNIQAGKIDLPLNNVSLGYQSALAITNGTNNAFMGYQSGYANTSGGSNTGVGSIALNATTTGSNNTGIGMGALGNNTTGSNNTSVGSGALRHNTTAAANTAIGTSALTTNTTGSSNSALGAYSLQNNTTGSNNTAHGYSSLSANTTGAGNTADGAGSVQATTTGSNNTGLGNGALQLNTTGSNNTGSGAFTLQYNTTGTYNTATGYTALGSSTTGGYNVALGNAAGNTNTTGSNNTFLGSNADASSAALTNATAIGYNAKVAASNAIILGGTGSYAVNVGIGTSNPGNFLEVNSGTGGASGLRLKQLPSGGVLFVSSSSDVTENNSNFYFDNANYRLGITAGTTPNSTLQVGGSFATAVSTKTTSYTAGGSDHTILCNSTGGAMSIGLPSPSGATGRIYVIKKISSDANAVTIGTYYSASTIDGASTYTITSQYSSVELTTDGTSWYILASH